MRYEVTEIEERVFVLLDENKEILAERVEYGDPGMSLPVLIRMLLPEAARTVLLEMPLDEISECLHLENISGYRHIGSDRGQLVLPADFLRLVWLRMSDWPTGLQTPLAVGSEEYRLRFRDTGGLRQGRRAPAMAIVRRGDKVVAEIFGTVGGARVVELDYLPLPRIKDGILDLPETAFPPVCENLASRIRSILNPS